MATWILGAENADASFGFVHLAVHFSVRHVVEHPLRGRFQHHTLNFSLDDEDLSRSTVEVDIDAGSLGTGHTDADAQLRSADVFDVERFPAITFRSRQLAGVRPGRYRVTGMLTVRGVAREVVFDLDQSAADGDSAAFSCKMEVDAADLGITCEPCWAGIRGASVFDRVEVELGFHATKGHA